MEFKISFARKPDGGWVASVSRPHDGWVARGKSLAGMSAGGASVDEARKNVMVLALRKIADKVEREQTPLGEVHFVSSPAIELEAKG